VTAGGRPVGSHPSRRERVEEAKGLLFFGTPEEKDSKDKIAICRRFKNWLLP
jgi:hypothetical protein